MLAGIQAADDTYTMQLEQRPSTMGRPAASSAFGDSQQGFVALNPDVVMHACISCPRADVVCCDAGHR